uniref:BZIP domain-containing protein n=1 Tax=Rhabditophanes sp. KR3021 TaxID=114890 RepID=A0AC35TU38_9BILA
MVDYISIQPTSSSIREYSESLSDGNVDKRELLRQKRIVERSRLKFCLENPDSPDAAKVIEAWERSKERSRIRTIRYRRRKALREQKNPGRVEEQRLSTPIPVNKNMLFNEPRQNNALTDDDNSKQTILNIINKQLGEYKAKIKELESLKVSIESFDFNHNNNIINKLPQLPLSMECALLANIFKPNTNSSKISNNENNNSNDLDLVTPIIPNGIISLQTIKEEENDSEDLLTENTPVLSNNESKLNSSNEDNQQPNINCDNTEFPDKKASLQEKLAFAMLHPKCEFSIKYLESYERRKEMTRRRQARYRERLAKSKQN